jgi:hypothetical protein
VLIGGQRPEVRELLHDRARLGGEAVSRVLPQLAVVDRRERHDDPPVTTKHPRPLEHLRIGRAFGLTGACPAERVAVVHVQVHGERFVITVERQVV